MTVGIQSLLHELSRLKAQLTTYGNLEAAKQYLLGLRKSVTVYCVFLLPLPTVTL